MIHATLKDINDSENAKSEIIKVDIITEKNKYGRYQGYVQNDKYSAADYFKTLLNELQKKNLASNNKKVLSSIHRVNSLSYINIQKNNSTNFFSKSNNFVSFNNKRKVNTIELVNTDQKKKLKSNTNLDCVSLNSTFTQKLILATIATSIPALTHNISGTIRDIFTDNNRRINQTSIDNNRRINRINIDNNKTKNQIDIDNNKSEKQIDIDNNKVQMNINNNTKK